VQVLERWWQLCPEAFHVVRGEQQEVRAFYVACFERELPPALSREDPLLARWLAHRAHSFPPSTRPVLLSRAMLSRDAGSAACEEQAACYLDIKRAYMENLDLMAIYVADHSGGEWPVYERLSFRLLPELTLARNGRPSVCSAVLDFGPGVLAWLAALMDGQSREPENHPALPFALDRASRELVLGDRRRALTKLEYGVLDQLEQQLGRVLSREQLLEAVWGQAHAGSNVVDAVVRSLRKKLGAHGSAIRTVTGFGYKLRRHDS
jgi:hypothetical protein